MFSRSRIIGIPGPGTQTAATLMGHQDCAQRIRRLYRVRAIAGAGAEPRSRLIMTCAMCGFANFGSLGILIGALSATPSANTKW